MKVKFLYNEENADLFAYFPEEIESSSAGENYYLAYSRIGQHSGCNPRYADDSRQATESEYSDLLAELVSIGYNDLEILNSK